MESPVSAKKRVCTVHVQLLIYKLYVYIYVYSIFNIYIFQSFDKKYEKSWKAVFQIKPFKEMQTIKFQGLFSAFSSVS